MLKRKYLISLIITTVIGVVIFWLYNSDGWILSVLIFVLIFSFTLGRQLQRKGYHYPGLVCEALGVLVFVALFSQFSNSRAVVDITPNSSDTILTIKNSGLVNVEDIGVSLSTYNISSTLSIDYVYKMGGGGDQYPIFNTLQPDQSQNLNLSFLSPSSSYAPPSYGDFQVSVARITYRNSINKEEYIRYFVLSPLVNPSSETGISGPFQRVNEFDLIRQEIINDQIATFNDNVNDIEENN